MDDYSDNSASNPYGTQESSSNSIDSGTEDLKKRAFDLSAGDPLTNHESSGQNGMTNHVNNHFQQPAPPKDHHSSRPKEHSSSSHKHSSSSSSSKHRDGSSSKDRDRDREKDKHKSHSSSSQNHSSSSKDKHREGSSSSSKHKDGSSEHRHKSSSSSSSSKSKEHKEGSSSSKSHSSSSSKEHSSSSKHSSSSSSSKPKEGSSSSSSKSSSSKPKDGSSSSSSKHSSNSSSKDKERDREKDKHHSSSSSKDKHRDKSKEGGSGSSKSDKPRDKVEKGDGERPKHKEGKDKEREKDREREKEREKKEKLDSPKKEMGQKPVEVKKEPEPSASPVKSSSPAKRMGSPIKAPKIEPLSDEDDAPLSHRLLNVSDNHSKEVKKEKVEKKATKRSLDSDDDDDAPLSARMEKVKKVKPEHDVKVKEEDADFKPKKKKKKVEEDIKPAKGKKRKAAGKDDGPEAKKEKEDQQVWRWWEEARRDDGVKWTFLQHKGPVFAPDYEPLPKNVLFRYDGQVMQLSPEAEEVATFYARMLDHDYTTRDVFNDNFFKDWKKVMTKEEREKLKDLKKCNFREMADHFKVKTEEKKQMSKEEKQRIKEQNAITQKEYGFCKIDGHVEKIGNFKIEPPGLFRGRGDHPKQGMLKRRVQPEDVIINCSKDSNIPVPPAGHKWKEVRHDNTVTWLASWTENIQGSTKYVMLNAASKLKGEKDWQKYEVARKLHKCVDKIRATYREDWKSKEMRIRQRAVALYFIDKLALRAGNEKEEGETADTVGCCSLRVEHITLHPEKDGKEYVVEFDFLGKDSIRYQNSVPVEKRVFKNLERFMEKKEPSDDIFDRLNTTILNKHLHDLMEGLTAKVFRTYNASRTLQEQLNLLTNPDDIVPAKLLAYNRANRAVAVLCNHQRAVPKTFHKSMERLQEKITDKRKEVKEAKKVMKDMKGTGDKNSVAMQKQKKKVARLQEQLNKLEVQATDKDENKEIALSTSKLNYLDPRISVAWCKKFDVPIEKIYNKTQRDKFRWAIDMAGPEFVF